MPQLPPLVGRPPVGPVAGRGAGRGADLGREGGGIDRWGLYSR